MISSTYMLVFKVPGIGEKLFGDPDNPKVMIDVWNGSHKGGHSYQHGWVKSAITTMTTPGVATNALNYYRQNMLMEPVAWMGYLNPNYYKSIELSQKTITIPTLTIGGAQDAAVLASTVEGCGNVSDLNKLHMIADAGHFV